MASDRNFKEALNLSNTRIIKTARSEDEINKAVDNGFFPLIKMVNPLTKLTTKFCVLQHRTTKKIIVLNDFRIDSYFDIIGDGNYDYKKDYEEVIPWSEYYPHYDKLLNPFAAYLIPNDIKIGEMVWLEDLIDDVVGQVWNQGDQYRLESSLATWNGKDFDIDYNKEDISFAVG